MTYEWVHLLEITHTDRTRSMYLISPLKRGKVERGKEARGWSHLFAFMALDLRPHIPGGCRSTRLALLNYECGDWDPIEFGDLMNLGTKVTLSYQLQPWPCYSSSEDEGRILASNLEKNGCVLEICGGVQVSVLGEWVASKIDSDKCKNYRKLLDQKARNSRMDWTLKLQFGGCQWVGRECCATLWWVNTYPTCSADRVQLSSTLMSTYC